MPSWRMPISRGAVALLVCIPLVRGYVAGISRELSRPPEIQAMRATAELLSPNDTIVTDERSARVLPLLWGYAETPFLSAFENDVSGLAPGTLVFINREWMQLHQELNEQPAPGFWHSLPTDWQLVHRVPQGEIYRVPASASAPMLGNR